MCHMAAEALLHGGSPLTSRCSKAFQTSSDFPSCSFLPSKAKGAGSHGRLASQRRLIYASPPKSLYCQAITSPLPRHVQHLTADPCDAEQQVSSPDRWMEDCVCDIVRNINEAPFLHLLFDSKDNTSGIKSRRQRVMESENLSIEDKWREVKDLVMNASPDGVVLVHHLNDEAIEGCCMKDGLSSEGGLNGSVVKDRKRTECCKSTNLWGVLVLGKTVTQSACYILKTTSVASSFGSCTQFCLTKAKCFGPSWCDQAQNCWLLSTESRDHSSQGDACV